MTKIQATSRSENTWSEIFSSTFKRSHPKKNLTEEKKKSRLNSARKLKGIYYIGLKYKELNEILKNTWRKSEVHLDFEIACKFLKTSGKTSQKASDVPVNSKLAIIVTDRSFAIVVVRKRWKKLFAYAHTKNEYTRDIRESKQSYCRKRIQFSESL